MSRITIVAAAALLCASSGVAAQENAGRESGLTADELIERLSPEAGSEDVRYRGLAITPAEPEPATETEPVTEARPETEAQPPADTGAAATAQPGTDATASAPPPRVALEINFAFDSARLTPAARADLDEVAAAMQSSALARYDFLLEGHTDASGSAAYNQDLSERRARAARDYLTRRGVAPGRIVVRGMGERRPLTPANPTAAVNRRVEITNIGPGT